MYNSILEIRGISKIYSGKPLNLHALQNISLNINPGDIYGIIGLSGAGKSTLIRCMAGLIKPTTGQIYFKNQDITNFNPKALRDYYKNIGMIFQNCNLLDSRNVRDNIAYPLEIAKISVDIQEQRIDVLLNYVGLTAKKYAYPLQLSGGEKQRVGIARALANKPQILFCDEATSALDPQTTKEILELLKNINKDLNITIVLITHEMEVIKKICNKVAVIEDGKILEQGNMAQVFAEPKSATTKNFLQNSTHEIPQEILHNLTPNKKLLRLSFKGTIAKEPIISQMIKKFDVDANILLGWIDNLQMMTVGTLVIELLGPINKIHAALIYLKENSVYYEVLE